MARTTVKTLEEKLAALEARVAALEQQQKRRIGFHYEGEVGGHLIEQHEDAPFIGDRRRRG